MVKIRLGSKWTLGTIEVEVIDVAVNADGIKIVTTETEDGDMDYDTLDFFLENYEPVFEPSRTVGASSILATASDMLGERGKQYDTNGEERSMAKIVASFNAKTGRDLSELEGWLFMTDLKAVRALAGGSMDCFVDGAAYFALAGESVGDK